MSQKLNNLDIIPLKTEKVTYNIHLKGIVQGVGFRPYVYRTAVDFGLNGSVKNDLNGVFIRVSGERFRLQQFYDYLLRHTPAEAIIASHSLAESTYVDFNSFVIENSKSENENINNTFITPDFAMCESCRDELKDPHNRRFLYPFITCTDCGPRYSILESLPFDRENTSMARFNLCERCSDEFYSPSDRRFYSQTNSCHECGIKVKLHDSTGEIISDQEDIALSKTSEFIEEGKIVAVKGVGGFLLLCDATNKQAVETLRKRKSRPTKPFAVLYPGYESIDKDYHISEKEKDLLTSEIAPIVLLSQKNNHCNIAGEVIAPKLNKIGVFLPYAPLLELILSTLAKPIVATSANISGSNLIYTNEQALKQLHTIADYILVHNRDITMPQDDSVMQVSKETNTKIILRTSRGMSPVYFSIDDDKPLNAIGYGSLLKSSICIAASNMIYMSQYLGNTNDFDSQENYKDIENKLCNLLRIVPTNLACDKHPDYFTTHLAEQKAEKSGNPLTKVQHHEAHFFAILGEHQLLREKVLGVIWDGTGLGEDGNIWGGEFFIYNDYKVKRENHFEYVSHILGDKFSKEPRLSSLSFFKEIPNEIIQKKFNSSEWNLYNKILSEEKLKTSSVGRLFDAIAALLDLSLKQSYEGEAALLLENIASEYRAKHNKYDAAYSSSIMEEEILIEPMLREILIDVNNNEESGKIALKFHFTLVSIIAKVAQMSNINKIAFSGGVFQNALLIDLLKLKLEKDYKLYFHEKISSNDENISLGQIVALKCKKHLQK